MTTTRTLLSVCGAALACTAMAQNASLDPVPILTQINCGSSDPLPEAHVALHRALSGLLRGMEVGDIPGAPYGESFDNIPGSGIEYVLADLSGGFPVQNPLIGQPNAYGNNWNSSGNSTNLTSVVNPATLAQAPHWDASGAVNPDPLGVRGNFMAVPRGSLNRPRTHDGGWTAGLTSSGPQDVFTYSDDRPLVVVVDCFKQSIDSFSWVRPVSGGGSLGGQSCVVTNAFAGGYNFSNAFAQFVNEDKILDRFVVLGSDPGNFSIGQFFGSRMNVPVQRWHEVAFRLDTMGYSFWVRDADPDSPTSTVGAQALPFAGDPDVDFSQDWVQAYPGLKDSDGPGIVQEAFGGGRAFNQFLAEAAVIESRPVGGFVAPMVAATASNGLQFLWGFDPHATEVPVFAPSDVYYDNIRFYGESLVPPSDAPPCTLPYFDDAEWLTESAFRLNVLPWFTSGAVGFSYAATMVDSTVNATLGGTKSVRQQNVYSNDVYQREFGTYLPGSAGCSGPLAAPIACPDNNVEYAVSFRVSGTNTNRGFRLADTILTGADAAHVLFGARDTDGDIVDGVFVRQPNPNFDPTAQLDPHSGPGVENVVFKGENRPHILVPAVYADNGQAAVIPPVDQFDRLRFVLEAPLVVGPPMRLDPRTRIYLREGDDGDFRELVPDPAFSTTHSMSIDVWRTEALTADQLQFWSGNNPQGFGDFLWVDDVFVDGVPRAVPTPDTIDDPPFTEQTAFSLPFFDDFTGYKLGDVMAGQGFTSLRSTDGPVAGWPNRVMFSDGPALSPGADVYLYEVKSIESGALPGGAGVGDILALGADIPPTLTPINETPPGSIFSDRDFVYVVVGDRQSELATGTWRLLSAMPEEFDPDAPANHIDAGRLEWDYLSRWDGGLGVLRAELQEIDFDDPAGSARGVNVGRAVVIPNRAGVAPHPEIEPQRDLQLSGVLPEVVMMPPDEGDEVRARLDAQLYVFSDTDFPRTGYVVGARSSAPFSASLVAIALGGPNLITDGTLQPSQNTGNFHYEVPGPPTGFPPPPQRVWVDTGVAAPLNTWFTLRLEIDHEGDWVAFYNDGSTTGGDIENNAGFVEFASGQAIDASVNNANLSSLERLVVESYRDVGGDGVPVLPRVEWSNLAIDHTPADLGVDDHCFYRITSIDTGNPSVAGIQIQTVDQVHGSILNVRDIRPNDVIVIPRSTLPMGVEHCPANTDWAIANPGVGDGVARGTWVLQGQP